MIGKLKGILDTIESDRVILDVSGVGYIVYCSGKTLANLTNIGEAASLLIHMQVKEDDISLYGFLNIVEKEWFENLIIVQGIGPKLALVILSTLEPNQLINVILTRQKEAFKSISGVGPKLAERIFTELNKKAELYTDLYPNLTKQPVMSANQNENIKDALTALGNLGYNRHEATNACHKIYKNNPDITINDLIKLALKELSNA